MDRYDISFLLDDINSNMPKITDNTATVKRSFSQGMPKNLSDYMSKVNDKFLDNTLGNIEDFSLKLTNDDLTQWFKEYQNRYFGAMIRDSFLKINEDKTFGTINHYRPLSIFSAAFIAPKKIKGATLERSVADRNNANSDTIVCTSLPTGTAGEFYDQLAVKTGTVGSYTGNIRLGLYDDVAGTPTNLSVETGSLTAPASANDYTNQAVTEFALPTTTSWFAHNQSTAGWSYRDDSNSLGAGTRKYKAWTFGAFQNPTTSMSAGQTIGTYCKCSHS